MAVLGNALESAQNAIGKGVSTVRDTVSGVALESFGFVRGFAHMCEDGWSQGWHERNGGNASYRLTEKDVSSARSFFADEKGAWIPLGVQVPALAGEYFLVTAAGSSMRNVADDPKRTCGIIEVNDEGDAYRMRWGFRDGGRPTSELSGHVLVHAARMRATSGTDRVLYHAHPVPVIVLSKTLPLDACTFSRELLGAMAECVMVIPEGVGVVGFEVPGSLELARASADAMEHASAVVWAHHGLLCAGDTFDDAFGRAHVVVKAAEICVQTRMLAGGDASANQLRDDDLRAVAQSLGIEIDGEFLTDRTDDL